MGYLPKHFLRGTGSALIFVCWIAAPQALAWNVFDEDNRVEMDSMQYPWSAIGRIENPRGHCTGTLVAVDLVLTAAHCVLDGTTRKTLPESSIVFKPNVIRGNSGYKSHAVTIWVGTFEAEKDHSSDWALIRIADPLGKSHGYLGYQTTLFDGFDASSYSLVLPGYSMDFMEGRSAGVHWGCHIRDTEPLAGYLLHDCDMTLGASGAPILWNGGEKFGWRVVALNVAHRPHPQTLQPFYGVSYTKDRANIALDAGRFAAKLRELRGAATVHRTPNAPVAPPAAPASEPRNP